MKPRILITESSDFSFSALDLLQTRFDITAGNFDRKSIHKELQSAQVLWVRLGHYIDAGLIGAAKDLKYIVTPTTGLNHIDVRAAEDNGVSVLSLRGDVEFLRTVPATAEHTIAILLALLRNIPAAAQSVLHGEWLRDNYKGNQLSGKTVGIVGYGRIGQLFASYLAAFNVRVIATDPYVDPADHLEVEFLPLPVLLSEADIVSLHVNLSKESENLMDYEEFSLMKDSAILLNSSRGELVREAALLDALDRGVLRGAALDVLCDEHIGGLKDNSLIEYASHMTNLLITPHIGGCTVESMESTELHMAQKLLRETR